MSPPLGDVTLDVEEMRTTLLWWADHCASEAAKQRDYARTMSAYVSGSLCVQRAHRRRRMVDFIVCMYWFRWLRRSGRSCGPGSHLQRTSRRSDGLVEHLAHGMSVMQFLVSCALWRWYVSSSVGLISLGNRSSSSEGRQEVSYIEQTIFPFSTGMSFFLGSLVHLCYYYLFSFFSSIFDR